LDGSEGVNYRYGWIPMQQMGRERQELRKISKIRVEIPGSVLWSGLGVGDLDSTRDDMSTEKAVKIF